MLSISITSAVSVASTSKIVINFPESVYLKVDSLTPPDCSYTIGSGNSTYTACQFNISSDGWLNQLNLTNLGTTTVPANTKFLFTMTLTNAWTTVPLSSKSIMVYVCSPEDSFLSQGSISLATLNKGGSSFLPTVVSSLDGTQTSTFANTNNNITFSYKMTVPIPQGTLVRMSVPKSLYSLNLTSLKATPAPTAVSETQS